ncbi:MAG: trypsin-like serine protease [Candidatus Staskawiczbacteria bacterium]|nr:trypsin-like serine protease [Candidatus Staskawiczbacteria bacterium]
MYDLPKVNFKKQKEKILAIINSNFFKVTFFAVIIIVAFAFVTGKVSWYLLQNQANEFLNRAKNELKLGEFVVDEKPAEKYVSRVDYEQAIIDTVKSASPSVVSIVISKNLPVYEQQLINPFGDVPGFDFQIPQYVQRGTELKQVGAGSGFIVSEDGLVLTNKHVVLDKSAEYTVLTNDGKKYSAKVLALDPVQDLAILKINSIEKFPAIKLGDSNSIEIGQGAIAIGNSLGEFRNTVSVGIISGLGRTVFASGSAGFSETLEDIIQTDAAINPGNSGGPLLNLKGEVIGVNVAMAQGAQSIGFAIPINIAKRDINQVVLTNKITYPFLGVRYLLVDDKVKKDYELSVDYGALIIKGDNGEIAITKDSSAEKAGIKEGDIILEFGKEKVTKENSLSKIISRYSPEDSVEVKVMRNGSEISLTVILGERN